MVLEAIYGPQFSMVSEHCVRLSLDLPAECPVATRQDAQLLLDITRPAAPPPPPASGGAADGGSGAAAAYPDVAPLVGVSCTGLAAGGLRHLTRTLAQVGWGGAAGEAGQLHHHHGLMA